MGYILHQAIIVTACGDLDEVREKALDLGLPVVGPGEEVVNGYRSLLVGPDGSKEGWDRSNDANSARTAFIAWLKSKRWKDGSSPYDWVEISYGGDEPERNTRITRFHGEESPNED